MGSELKPLATPNANKKEHLPLLATPMAHSLPRAAAPDEVDLERTYAAFVRRDAYGVMGRGALPFLEKARLVLALLTLLPLRFALSMLIIFLYFLICRFCTLFSPAAPTSEEEEQPQEGLHLDGWRRAVIVRSGKVLSRWMLFVMGFYWISTAPRENLSTTEPEKCERPGVIVSNHVSYVDILYHMSTSFPSFVAKRSVARLPLVGIISKCLGCVYVQRESKSSDSKGVAGIIMDKIQKANRDKFLQVMLTFPEGTTTNGDFLLPFKTGAFLAKTPVLPVILKYPYSRFSPAWDSISGVRHIILLLCQFQNRLEVMHLPVYYPSQQEKDDPKLYAANVRKLMAMEGNLTLSDVGLGEKRVYHAALIGNGHDFHRKVN